MIERVYTTHATWSEPPAKFEAGTPPIAQAIALGTAIEWVEQIGLREAHEHSMVRLRQELDDADDEHEVTAFRNLSRVATRATTVSRLTVR